MSSVSSNSPKGCFSLKTSSAKALRKIAKAMVSKRGAQNNSLLEWSVTQTPPANHSGWTIDHCGGVLLDGKPCGPTGASPSLNLRQQPFTMSPCGKLTWAE